MFLPRDRFVEYQDRVVDFELGTVYLYVRKYRGYRECVGSPDSHGYLMITVSRDLVFKHRFILSAYYGRPLKDEEIVNHRDHHVKNNTLSNLEIVTKQQNCQYRKHSHGRTSQYMGVHWHKIHEKFQARIAHNGKQIHLGYFDKEQQASQARNEKALELNRDHNAYYRISNDAV